MHKFWVAALIVLSLAIIAMNSPMARPSTGSRPTERVGPSPDMVNAARMVLVFEQMEQAAERTGLAEESLDALKGLQKDEADRLRRSIVAGEVNGGKAALAVIDTIAEGEPSRGVLQRRYSDGPVTEEEQAELVEQHGWFGRLSGIYGLPDDHPDRIAFLAPFERGAKLLFIVPLIVVPAFLGGLVLLFIFLRRCRNGTMPIRFRLHDEGAGDLPWLQIVVIFLGLGVLGSVGLFAVLRLPEPVAMWLLAVPILWPLFRGVSVREWRGALGLRGGFREIGAGVVGYIAGLPVIALGLWMTATLVQVTGMEASHPIAEDARLDSAWLIIMGAVVWAPLVEELVFRGAFYRYLRPRFTVIGSTLLSALLFASLHPQGLTGIPALMSVGIVLAGIREWRGSTIGPMTMHAIHNACWSPGF